MMTDWGDVAAAVAAVAALVGVAVGLWTAHRLEKLAVRVDALETAHHAHVNAPGLHR